jgi:threonylcarbamoyladenosine tRNA methylthiotransferase MtaB
MIGEKRTLSLVNLGCKLNQTEGEVVADLLRLQGYIRVRPTDRADVSIINTCAVTSRAEFQSRQAVRQAARRNPNGLVVGTGCSAQLKPGDLASAGAHVVVGNSYKEAIPLLLAHPAPAHARYGVVVGDPDEWSGFQSHAPARFGLHTRAFLKVQEGCDLHCTFCSVRLARGRSRSLPPEEAARRALRFAESGYRELVMTGINLASYGADLAPPIGLGDLLARLAHVPGLTRLRLGSLDPRLVVPELLRAARCIEGLCPHFHLPLQSGSPRVLRRMGRRYGPDQYRALVEEILRLWPSAAVGADVIAGFPGEEEADFQATLDLLGVLPLAYLHVFPYSARGGTRASELRPVVPPFVRTARARHLRAVGAGKRRDFVTGQIGSSVQVLLERPCGGNGWEGLTPNYVRVRVEGTRLARGQVVEVVLKAREGDRAIGRLQSAR